MRWRGRGGGRGTAGTARRSGRGNRSGRRRGLGRRRRRTGSLPLAGGRGGGRGRQRWACKMGRRGRGRESRTERKKGLLKMRTRLPAVGGGQGEGRGREGGEERGEGYESGGLEEEKERVEGAIEAGGRASGRRRGDGVERMRDSGEGWWGGGRGVAADGNRNCLSGSRVLWRRQWGRGGRREEGSERGGRDKCNMEGWKGK